MRNQCKARTLRNLSFAAKNYVAGLLEGEGCFHTDSKRKSIRISAMMGDLDPLKRLRAFCGGHIYGPTQRNLPNRSPMYQWSLTTKLDCIALAYQLFPFMSPRRQTQIEKLVAYE